MCCKLSTRVHLGSPIPETERNEKIAPQAPRSNELGVRVIGPATAKLGASPSRLMFETRLGVIVNVDLERGGPVVESDRSQRGFAALSLKPCDQRSPADALRAA
jgi:hypothetical protein